MSLPGPPRPLRIHLFSHARTGSNLLRKLFEQHPQIEQKTYPFMWVSLFGPEVPEVKVETPKFLREQAKLRPELAGCTAQSVVDEVQLSVNQIESKQKLPMIKDHAVTLTKKSILVPTLPHSEDVPTPAEYRVIDRQLDLPEETQNLSDDALTTSNPTIYPDRFMLTLAPVLIIRHPARMVPSFYKAINKSYDQGSASRIFQTFATYHWSRTLYEWYSSQYVSGGDDNANRKCGWPIVIDGDEIIMHAHDLTSQLCGLLNIDLNGVQYTWKATTHDLVASEGRRDFYSASSEAFFGTLSRSTGIERDEKFLSPPNVEEEMKEWIQSYGEKEADAIKAAVEKAMPDYEYLYQYRLKPTQGS